MTAPSRDAVFFDFDGVLVESIDIKEKAFLTLYGDCSSEVQARALAHHKAHEGISRLEKIRFCHREFLGVELDDDAVDSLGRRFSALVEDAVIACPLVAGAGEFLEASGGRMALFVVSGTPDDELKRVIAGRRMMPYFTSVHGSPPYKAPIVEGLLAKHGIAAGRALFVGDAMTDYHAARATGLAFLGRVAPGRPDPFPEGTRTVPDLTALEQACLSA